MKVLGRVSFGSFERPHASMGNDLIVQMTVEEWNAWRGLTGPSDSNNFALTAELVETFLQLRHAMEEAAKTMGMAMVPVKLRDAAASMDGSATVLVPDSIAARGLVCEFEDCRETATRMNGAGDRLCGKHAL